MFFSNNKKITIGMATYDDYDGVYFTIQSLLLYQEITKNTVDIIVIDNNPESIHGKLTKKLIDTHLRGKYIPYTEKISTSVRNLVFENSKTKYTLCLDSHVLLQPKTIKNILEYFESDIINQENLLQGPLLYDDGENLSTHFEEIWNDGMFGKWATNHEELKNNQPFEIPMQGLGAFACTTSKWPGLNKNFVGFGGEEGYIHEKFRKQGGKVICLPSFKWMHRFDRPKNVPYPLNMEDRVWNYFIGWLEIYNNPNHQMILDIKTHFEEKIGYYKTEKIFEEALNVHNGKKTLDDVYVATI